MTKNVLLISITIIALLGLVSYQIYRTLPDGMLHIYILDIGQGDASLIQTPSGKYILIDAGPNSYTLEKNLQKIMPRFHRSLDIFIVTHSHYDHFAGFFDVEQKYPPRLLITSLHQYSSSFKKMLQTLKKQTHHLIANDSNDIQIDKDLLIDTLYPLRSNSVKEYKNINNASLVQKLSYKDFSILFTGDIEIEGIEKLVEIYRQNLKSTVLKSAHHGSDNGWTREFLDLVNPTVTTISAGKNNRYNHPFPETLKEFEKRKIQTLVTAQDGIIEIVTDGHHWNTCTWREVVKKCTIN